MTRNELITALEKATGPDEFGELNARIEAIHRPGWTAEQLRPFLPWTARNASGYCFEPRNYIGSRDAMLPGAEKLRDWIIFIPGDKGCSVTMSDITDGFKQYRAEAATEPLARRIAELKALVPNV